jgi:hypothetical protein
MYFRRSLVITVLFATFNGEESLPLMLESLCELQGAGRWLATGRGRQRIHG